MHELFARVDEESIMLLKVLSISRRENMKTVCESAIHLGAIVYVLESEGGALVADPVDIEEVNAYKMKTIRIDLISDKINPPKVASPPPPVQDFRRKDSVSSLNDGLGDGSYIFANLSDETYQLTQAVIEAGGKNERIFRTGLELMYLVTNGRKPYVQAGDDRVYACELLEKIVG